MINFITYNSKDQNQEEITQLEALEKLSLKTRVHWLDLEDVKESEALEIIARKFSLHHLTLDDIKGTEHLPKLEDFDNYIFLSIKMLRVDPKNERIIHEHLSMVLGNNFLLTFQEFPGDVFQNVRNRISKSMGRLRDRDNDYLFYALINAVVKNYFTVAEHIRSEIEELEEFIVENPEKPVIQDILDLKKVLNAFRKYIAPLREEIIGLNREPRTLISKSTLSYFRDVVDDLNNIVSQTENFRDMIAGLRDLYMANLSISMNNVMKTLTVISAIFIPLTFLAGIYGMNFDHMPELAWPWAYPALWGFMILITLGLISIMKIKKWF